MTDRATFGDFAGEAGRYLNLRAGQPGAASRPGYVQEVSWSLRWLITVMGRYVSDISTAAPTAARRRSAPGPWERACTNADNALITAGAYLRHDGPGHSPGEAASPLARQMDAAAVTLTIGRDLLHTHDATGPAGARRPGSEWTPVIVSAPVRRALLCEVASWTWQIAAQGAGFAQSRGPGLRSTQEARRQLNAACQWLWTLDIAVRSAQRHDPVSAGDFELLHAIPVNTRAPRRLPDGTEPVTGLCAGTISSAERVRHAAVVAARHDPRSPEITVSSWRRVAATSMVTSHHCEILLRSLAERMAQPGLGRLSRELLASADAAADAGSHWLQIARALDQVTTDTRGHLSLTAAEAGDLALWTGRLAYADPRWSLARGPAHAPRSPASLAPGLDDVPRVVAAIHHGCETLTRLAGSDQDQVRAVAGAGRLLVATSSLSDKFDIPQPFAPSPPSRTDYLLSIYRDAGTASAQATSAVAGIAAAVRAPSQILTAMATAAASRQGTPRHAPTPLPEPSATRGFRDLPGPVERILHDLGVTSPEVLRRGSAIDRAGERLIIDSAEKLEPHPRQSAAGQPGMSGGAAELINHMLACGNPRVVALLHPPVQRQREPPEAEP